MPCLLILDPGKTHRFENGHHQEEDLPAQGRNDGDDQQVSLTKFLLHNFFGQRLHFSL
jgi:hypothetical protein